MSRFCISGISGMAPKAINPLSVRTDFFGFDL
jgi:hypothetical protein